MNKVTLVFPSHESLWLFHGQSRAINVAVRPRQNTISGLFSHEEINNARLQFGAIELQENYINSQASFREPASRDRRRLRGL